MIITIPFEEFIPEIKQAYSDNKIKGIGIDFQYNGIYGYIEEKEVCVFDFSRYFKADNRYSSYEIFCGPTQILIEFV